MGRRKKSSKKVGAAAAKSTGNGRGRKADPVETARRVDALKRVDAGEINNAQAAKELGLKLGTWAVWKSNYAKRSGGTKRRGPGRPPKAASAVAAPAAAAAPKAKRGRPSKAATAAKSAASGKAGITGLQDLVAHLQGVQSFGVGLKAKLRELLTFVENEFPG